MKFKNILIAVILVVIAGGAVYFVNNANKQIRGSKSKGQTSLADKNTNSSSSNSDVSANTPDNSNEKAIAFTLKDLDGNTVSLSDYKGKKVFLNFFATWCPPCRGEMPDIEKIYESKKDDLVILAVNVGEDSKTVKDFISKNKYKFKVLLDTKNEASQSYNISSIPVSYFIDRSGNIVSKQVGAMSKEDMQKYIDSVK